MSSASNTSAKQQSEPDTKKPAPQVFKVNGNIVFYQEDANLILITADNYKFQVDDLQIRGASGTFRDILSLPPNDTTTKEATRTVPVTEKADLFHQWLHLIHCLQVDTTLDKTIHKSWALAQRKEEEEARFNRANNLLRLNDKYDSQLYDQLVRQRLFDILRGEKHPAIPSLFFVLACRKEWPDMAKEAISHFRVYTDKSHPGNFPPSFIQRIGVECYTAYVKAYFAGQKSRKADGVNWEKVSQAFVLPKKSTRVEVELEESVA